MARRSGYTLLELTLVLAVLVLLASLAIPSMEGMYADVRIEAGADQVRAVWADARTQAADEVRTYRFSVKPGTGQFRLEPDDTDSTTPGQGAAGTPGGGLVVEDSLPDKVSFSLSGAAAAGGGSGNGYVPVAYFLYDGTARDDVSITFDTDGARPLTLTLRALTGAVTVQRGTPGGR